MNSNVVFPDPDGPSSATTSPRSSSREIPLRTGTVSLPSTKLLVTSLASRTTMSPTLDQLRKTTAGSSPAILRNEINEAPRQRATAPTKTSPTSTGGMISFRSSPASTGRTA